MVKFRKLDLFITPLPLLPFFSHHREKDSSGEAGTCATFGVFTVISGTFVLCYPSYFLEFHMVF